MKQTSVKTKETFGIRKKGKAVKRNRKRVSDKPYVGQGK